MGYKSTSPEITVKEETTRTGGHYQGSTYVINAISMTAGDWKELDISFPFPVSILGAQFNPASINIGDIVQALVAPNTIIGDITDDVAVGATVIDVQQSVIDNTAIGYNLKLDDGISLDDMGSVILIDESTLKITLENAAANNFLLATPTNLRQTIECIPNFEIVTPGRVEIGEIKIGGSYLPKDKVLRIRYRNNDGVDKKFAFYLEYLY